MTLEVQGLRFKRGKLEIGPVEISLDPGEIISICGKNGSGKTSSLYAMAGLDRIDSGKVIIDGANMEYMNPREISRKIAIVKQEIPTPMSFTVNDIMEISAFTRGNDRDAINQSLDLCGISHLINREFSTLSGGEKRMVMIAAGIYQDSSYIFLDEPSSFLDIDKISTLSSILVKLKKMGRGIIVVNHDINYARKISDKIMLMKNGKVIAYGNTDETITVENLERTYDAYFDKYDSPEGLRFYASSSHF